MTLTAGTKLGPYEITSALGAGGMGEVYRARDTRLDRTVAIKVLPDHLGSRAELRERFDREARTVASLNHPHICILHDIGQQDGINYLVMEYLEGETLAQRLKKGPLSLEQVLRYAIEIADGLDKAHRKGITHRDLKPSNVMLTKSGTKLLDFGLAKLKASPAASSLSQLPTANDAITAQGTILGTLQYMAPEQLEGKEADARTDIFAFGVVVYEMATGKKAFEGKSQASLIAKILETDPAPLSVLQPMTPPALDRVVKKCLAKEAEKRWQDASDLCDELNWIAEGGPQTGMPTRGVTERFGRRALIVGAGAAFVAAVLAGVAVWILKPAPGPRPVTRTVISLPPDQRPPSVPPGPVTVLALSPDGSHLAYVSATYQLFLRAMDSTEARPLYSSPEGAFDPFFSPDGQWLGFLQSNGAVKKISVNGGAPVTLNSSFAGPRGGGWSRQGAIILGSTSGLQQLSDQGGSLKPLSHLENGEIAHRWPEVLPGGKAVVFDTGGEAPQIAVYWLASAQRRNLGLAGSYPRYAASGHLLYMQGSSLMAVPFDAERLEIRGAAVPVVEGVMQLGAGQYNVSATGTLAYISGTAGGVQHSLVWVSRNGAEQTLPAPPRVYVDPRLSPDGRQVAVEIEDQIWIYDLMRDTLSRLTFEGSANDEPAWSPDGKHVAFRSNKEGGGNLFWILADGSGGLERLNTGKYGHYPSSFSPDGRVLAFFELNPATQRDIWALHMDDRKAEPFLQTQFNEGGAVFSPDGRWLAYVSNESGRPEIYIQPYPGPGGKRLISTEGGSEPAWKRNGRELFYRSGNKMMAVDVVLQPTFSAGKPKMLFEGQYFDNPFPLTSAAYDVSADGQRFLMIKENSNRESSTAQINIVQNWFEELKQKVPTGKK